MMKDDNHLSYQNAGVNIEEANRLVSHIKTLARATHRPEVMQGIGGFAALFELPTHRYQQPVLVSSTDGVGTKLKLAIDLKRYDTIGIDLVAMCVNDLIVTGAEPLFFLDYYATGHLESDKAREVIAGIAQGCQLAGAALVGGETAEMPGMYAQDDYDLAGFCVGVVEKSKIIDGTKVQAGDHLIALASSGVHSNGYSLVRKILALTQVPLTQSFAGSTLGDILLVPTRIYVKSILQLLPHSPVHAVAHITGGGIVENLPRVLPESCKAIINSQSWQRPTIFSWLQEKGNIADAEMWLTFNCGVGMILVVPAAVSQECIAKLNQLGETAWLIGEIVTRNGAEASVEIC